MSSNSFDNIKAIALSTQTENAYSFDRYGRQDWFLICRFLITEGFNEEQAIALLRSKHMRWAADRGTMYTPYRDFRNYYKVPSSNTPDEYHWTHKFLLLEGLITEDTK